MTTTAKHRRHMGMTLSERLTAVTVPVTSLKAGDVIVDSFHHRSTVTADARVVRGLVEVGLSGYDYAYDQSETVLRISAVEQDCHFCGYRPSENHGPKGCPAQETAV